MTHKTLFILRHGETEYNRQRITQGRRIDASLNATGREQAGLFYEAYRVQKFDKVYTSSLRRTHETVAQFIEQGLPHEALADLDEISWGEFEGQTIDEHLSKKMKAIIQRWESGDYKAHAEGGEDLHQISARLRQAMAHIIAQKEEKKVLIATHGRALLILLCLLLGHELKDMHSLRHDNTGLYILHYDYKSGQYTLELENSLAHLSGMKKLS